MNVLHIDAICKFNQSNGIGDVHGAIAVLDEHPEIFGDQRSAGKLIFCAAREGNATTVEAVLMRGAPVNAVESGLLPHRPIVFAALGTDVECVRSFIKYGSEINWGWEVRDDVTGRVISGSPVCAIPLQHAVVKGNLEIIKILVEAGSLLNVLDNTNQTILDHAVVHCGSEVVEYLRSKGAKLSEEL